MTYAMLPQISPSSRQWIVCVRVSCRWHYRKGADDGPIEHTDLVLLDEQGNHMYAEISIDNVARFDPLLEEGKVYELKKIHCRFTKKCVQASSSTFHDLFYKTYNTVPFIEIPRPTSTPEYFVDVIGFVAAISDIEQIQTASRSTPSLKRTVFLRDSRAHTIYSPSVHHNYVPSTGPTLVVPIVPALSQISRTRRRILQMFGPNCTSMYTDPKYRISLIGSDGSDEAEFVLFGKIGHQIVRKSILSLLHADCPIHEPLHEMLAAACPRNEISNDIAAFVSQKYKFVVSVTDKSFLRQQPLFQVHRVDTAFGRQLHSSLFYTSPSSSRPSITKDKYLM